MKYFFRVTGVLITLGSVLVLCSPGGDEPEIVLVEVANVQGARVPEQTDLGWMVEFSSFRLAIRDLEFTTQGETHSRRERWQDRLIASAVAHPGHYAGGEVIGELPGDFLVDACREKTAPLGEARLLVGDYNGFNFSFRKATAEEDDLDETDALLHHTALLEGQATRDSHIVPFQAIIDIEDNTQLIGASLDVFVSQDTEATLGFSLLAKDKNEQIHLFDGIDFDTLLPSTGSGSVVIAPGDEAHNRIMKALSKHNYYQMDVMEEEKK